MPADPAQPTDGEEVFSAADLEKLERLKRNGPSKRLIVFLVVAAGLLIPIVLFVGFGVLFYIYLFVTLLFGGSAPP